MYSDTLQNGSHIRTVQPKPTVDKKLYLLGSPAGCFCLKVSITTQKEAFSFRPSHAAADEGQ